jgi:hypothetical protein
MSQGTRNFIVGCSLLLVFISIAGCVPGKQGGISFNCAPLISRIQSMLPTPKNAGQQAATDAGPTRPHPPVRTGDITTGPKVQAASQTIDSTGGTIAIDKPGDSMNGFIIDIQPNSYADSRKFTISSAPITKQTFGSDITPISPMISVDNGGGYSDELIYVRVPAKVPDGYFAMGFIYDPKTKQLEGMPVVGSDSESITIATRHFCDFFISMISKAILNKDIDSGFRPGIDDWQFTNYGSYIAFGHCEGQSLSAMWYYCTHPDGADACLYGRYDNNGEKPATPNFWQDDSLGYRFCSVIQAEQRNQFSTKFWQSLGGILWEYKNNKWLFKHVPGIGDEYTWNLFSYSIRATGEPQEVAIWTNGGGGHAVVAYKAVGNALYVADPNYPGNTERKIIYYSNDGKFKPYQSGANRAEIEKGNSTAYENIMYIGKSTFISWDTISQHWTEFKNKTIGNKEFPSYTINYVDDKGASHELKDGYVSPGKLILIKVATSTQNGAWDTYRDGVLLPQDANGNIDLKPGNNKLGVWVRCNAGDSVNKNFQYVDLKYISVIYSALSIDPPALAGEPNKDYTFTAKTDAPPSNTKYEWSVNGKQVQNSASDSLKTKFPDAGSYTISVSLLDGSGKEIASAEANANITKAALPADTPKPSGPQKFTALVVQASMKVKIYIDVPPNKPDATTLLSDILTGSFGGTNNPNGWSLPITWSGTSFSGSSHFSGDRDVTETASGSVSGDGSTITVLNYSVKSVSKDGRTDNIRMQAKNIPVSYNRNPGNLIVNWVQTASPLKGTLSYEPDYSSTTNSIKAYFQ